MENLDIKQNIKKPTLPINSKKIKPLQIQKEEIGNFSCLLIFNSELEIIELISYSNRNLKDNKFNENLFYVELETTLYFEIQDLLRTNKLKLTKNPIDFKITIDDIIATPLPPEPPTKDELMSKAILDQMIKFEELDEKTSSISSNLDNESLKQKNMEQKIRLLSKAILDLTIKSV